MNPQAEHNWSENDTTEASPNPDWTPQTAGDQQTSVQESSNHGPARFRFGQIQRSRAAGWRHPVLPGLPPSRLGWAQENIGRRAEGRGRLIVLCEMPARFGEMEARSMRDATEMNARWMRDGCEIWRDAGLYKIRQFSRNLSKSLETILSGGFLGSGRAGSHDSVRP